MTPTPRWILVALLAAVAAGRCAPGRAPRQPAAAVDPAADEPAADEPADPEVMELVCAIDERPDEVHMENTPAARRLAEKGAAALGPVLGLMESGRYATRVRAYAVLRRVTARMCGLRPGGGGWPTPQARQSWHDLWAANGDLRPEAPAADRRRSVALWRQWLAAQGHEHR